MSEIPYTPPEEATEKGYYGYEVDPTPNENYSLKTPPDAPTPETDTGAREAARKRRDDLRNLNSDVDGPPEATPPASREGSSS